MKKLTTVLFMLFLSVGLHASNYPALPTNLAGSTNFEPGETIYIEIPGFEVSQVNTLKSALTSSDVGAVWIGYCFSYRVISIKFPSTGLEVLENTLKQITGGFKIYSSSQVTYSITDACFNNE